MPREIPYRGDGNPRNIKPRKRFRNFKKERREIILSMLIVLVLFLIPLSLFIFGQSPYDNNTTNTGSFVIGLFLVLTLIAGIASISKFRKGYDIDISEDSEKDSDEKPEDSKNVD